MLRESPEDRRTQILAMEKIEEIKGWRLVTLHRRYHADWCAFNSESGEVEAFVEYKRRNCKHDDFETVFLDVNKYVHCTSLADSFGAAFVYVNEWDDAFGFCEPKARDLLRPDHLSSRRCSYRDDPDDEYLMIHIPLPRFELIQK